VMQEMHLHNFVATKSLKTILEACCVYFGKD